MTYIVIATLISLAIIAFMPKRLKLQEIYVTWGILAAVAINSDLFLGEILDLYDFGASGLQGYDLLVDALFPPALGIIYLNYLPDSGKKIRRYMLLWTLGSIGIEGLAVFFGFEHIAKGWSLFYSAPIYFLVFAFLNWHLRFLRNRDYR
ncbi:MAG TPA: hypothetical protein PKA10_08355 [Selenomonadales bacterium]|nr:hypothetical protein [Selenomonadales bacterium]